MIKDRIVLFVDDEKNILSSLIRSLHKWLRSEGFTGETANSVHEAMSILKEKSNDIAVIVSDQKMPDLKGSELSSIISKQRPDITMIILSGQSDMNDMADFIKAGVFSFIQKPWDIELLKAEIIKGAEVHELKRENRINKKRREREFRLAREFQESIFKTAKPTSDKINFKVSYKSTSETGVSGDYYDFIELDQNQFIVLIGDVAGHGIKTAFITAVIKSSIYPDYIKVSENLPFSPGHFLSWMNNRMCDFLNDLPDLFISFTAVLIDLNQKKVITANAGHPPMYLIKDDIILPDKTKGLVLGFNKNQRYEESSMDIIAGDTLLLCTDGLYPTGIGAQFFNTDNFVKVLRDNSSDLENHEKILQDIAWSTEMSEWEDDVTLITVKINENSGEPVAGSHGQGSQE